MGVLSIAPLHSSRRGIREKYKKKFSKYNSLFNLLCTWTVELTFADYLFLHLPGLVEGGVFNSVFGG